MDEKKLKQDILNSIDNNKVDDMSLLILEKYQNQKKNVKQKTPWYKSKIFYFAASPVLCAGIVLAIVLPLNIPSPTPSINTTSSSINNNTQVEEKHEEIAFSVLSAYNIAADNSLPSTPNLKARINQDDFNEHIEILNPYMSTAETLFKDGLNVSPVVYKLDSGDYQYQMLINDNNRQIEFLYNETSSPSYEEDEEEYHIEGIFLIDDIVYEVRGDKELEQEANESEYELTLKVSLNDYSYLIIEQEIETETTEKEIGYIYSLYENNRLSFSVEVSYEEEYNNKSVEIQILDNSGRRESEYFITESYNQDYSYLINYEINQDEGIIQVSISDDGNYFIYYERNLQYSITLERF